MGLNDSRFSRPGVHDQAWHYLLGLGPDLAFLQEALPPAWVWGEGQLVSEPFNTWGSVIFSPRYPLEPYRLPTGSGLRRLGAYLAYANASLPNGTESIVVSVHARHATATRRQLANLDPRTFARKSVPQPMVNDLIFHELAPLVEASFIAAGDWNTGRKQRSAKAGIEFFDRAHEQGWYDCVWDKFGKEVQTWFREGDVLVQDDHVFSDSLLGDAAQVAWSAADAVLNLRLSDHAPLIIDFDVEAIAMTNLAES
jgi:endonuclease/exonuclease/phosphatase (EEP) superfamily protein YafD